MRARKEKPDSYANKAEAWDGRWDAAFADWVQFTIGLILMAWGAYFLGPWDVSQFVTDASLTSAPSIIIGPVTSFLEVAAGLGCMLGILLRNNRVSYISLWATVGAYVVITVLRISTTGFFPFFWLFQLGLALIAGLLLLRLGLKNDGG